MKKLKNKYGFTLVELIVVLVILAILASLLIPALTGYIEMGKKKALISEARGIWTAAQAAVSEEYALGYNTTKDTSYNHTLTMKSGTKVGELGKVSNATLQDEQKNHHSNTSIKENQTSTKIAQHILRYLDSENASTAQYKFTKQVIPPSGISVKKFFETYPTEQVVILVFFNKEGKIVALNFGKEDYLVTMISGQKTTCERDGKLLISSQKK